jgi:hypothetical protein
MRLAWLRPSSRVIAAVLLLTSLWQLPHRAQDDEICVPAAAEAHDESKHVFTNVGAADHQDHCAICHWLRSLKPAFSSGHAVAAPTNPGRRLTASTFGVLRDPGADRLPARAPPSDRL